MINGVKLSQIQEIKLNHLKHRERLNEISCSRPKRNFLSLSFTKMLSAKKTNHENWKLYNKSREIEVMIKKNEKIFEKIIRLTTEKSPYHTDAFVEKPIYRHHNFKVSNKKRVQIINDQNPQLYKRIQKRRSILNHCRDVEEFKKTRQIVNRVQKFQTLKRMTNIKHKTLPCSTAKNNLSQSSDLMKTLTESKT